MTPEIEQAAERVREGLEADATISTDEWNEARQAGHDALDSILAELARLCEERERLTPMPETRDYLTRTIETIRNHRNADNCWPQWANLMADEIERMWGLLAATEKLGEGEA